MKSWDDQMEDGIRRLAFETRVVAARRKAASFIRRVTRRAFGAYNRLQRARAELPSDMLDAAKRLSGRVAGCGCVDDGAEGCHGDWCECDCHQGRA